MDTHSVKRNELTDIEQSEICTLKTPAGEEARFALPIDDSLVKNWSGFAELWFEESGAQGIPRILGASELRANKIYLLKGREGRTAAVPIEIHHKVIDESLSKSPLPHSTSANTVSAISSSVPSPSSATAIPIHLSSSPMTPASPPATDIRSSGADLPNSKSSDRKDSSKPQLPTASSSATLPVHQRQPSNAGMLTQPLASSSGRPPFKIIVVGDAFTGKTTFIKKYCKGAVEKNVEYKATLGFDFSMAVLRYKNEDLKLAFWDIAGQERFTNLTRSYYQGATGGFVVLDILNPKTYEGAKRWKADIDAKVHMKDHTPIPVVLLANKSDKLKEGVSPCMDLDQFAREHNFVGWLATSSFTNTNVKQAVNLLIGKMIEMAGPWEPPAPPAASDREASIRLTDSPANLKSESCCK